MWARRDESRSGAAGVGTDLRVAAVAGNSREMTAPSAKTPFLQRLHDGDPQIGILLTTGSREVAEVIQLAGVDWVFIDMEQGALEPSGVQGVLQALAGGPPALVRIPDNDAVWFKKVLDAGADGVIVPLVRSADDARKAVACAKYPPLGERSVGVGRAHGYGTRFKEYVERANDSVALVLQIEHIDAVEALDDILAVPGVDAAFVGPLDLSGSMGMTGDVKNPAVRAAIDDVRNGCAAQGMPVGIFAATAESAAEALAAGFRFVAVGTELGLLASAASQLLAATRDQLARSK